MACDNCQIKDFVIRTNERDIKQLRAELLDARHVTFELAKWIRKMNFRIQRRYVGPYSWVVSTIEGTVVAGGKDKKEATANFKKWTESVGIKVEEFDYGDVITRAEASVASRSNAPNET
jgi:hypothetical protein